MSSLKPGDIVTVGIANSVCAWYDPMHVPPKATFDGDLIFGDTALVISIVSGRYGDVSPSPHSPLITSCYIVSNNGVVGWCDIQSVKQVSKRGTRKK